jgi:hypothetical protein
MLVINPTGVASDYRGPHRAWVAEHVIRDNNRFACILHAAFACMGMIIWVWEELCDAMSRVRVWEGESGKGFESHPHLCAGVIGQGGASKHNRAVGDQERMKMVWGSGHNIHTHTLSLSHNTHTHLHIASNRWLFSCCGNQRAVGRWKDHRDD